MQIPGFQTFMLPILQAFKDGREHTLKEIRADLIKQFKFSEEALEKTIPSGRKTLFNDRTQWVCQYLKEARLIAACSRGIFKITERGKEVLAQNPPTIDIKFLRQFDEFNAFQRGGRGETHENENGENRKSKIHKNQNSKENTQKLGVAESIDSADSLEFTQTPEEQMENAYKFIQSTLADKLLDKIRSVEPSFFEKLVVDLLVKMGYGGSKIDIKEAFDKGQAEVTSKSRDGGIDGIIKQDKLGLDVVCIQAKRYNDGSSVSRKEIQSFVGALIGKGATKGVFITTSNFTKDARNYVSKECNKPKVILIDGKTLAGLMIEHDLGVKLEEKYELKKLDGDYFEEDFE